MLERYRLIWSLLNGPERKRAGIVLVLTLIMAVFELATVAGILPFLSILSDPGLLQENAILAGLTAWLGWQTFEEVALGMGLTVLGLVVVGMGVRAGVTYIQMRFALNLGYYLASRLLHGHLGQNYDFYLTRNSARLSQSILSEVDLIVRESLLPAVLLLSNGLILILIALLLFLANPMVAVVAVTVLSGVYILTYLILRRRIAQTGSLRVAANAVRFKVMQEITGSFKDIKMMGLERSSLQRFRTPAAELARLQTNALIMERLPRFALEATAYGAFLVAILILVVARGTDITQIIPILGLLAVAATKLFPALQAFYQNLALLRLSRTALERFNSDMAETKTVPLVADNVAPLPLRDRVTLSGATFAYPGTEEARVLGPIDLEILAYTTIGIVGGTGAGKTTIVDLILGLLHPTEGTVAVDSTPLDKASIPAWQRNIGYVPQTIFLTDDTIAANIAYGRAPEDVDMERVVAAAKLANLHDFILSDLREGYNNLVGERGQRLSGGQRQRIGIARALYHDPDVIVLDEATSALDNLTERAVMEAVQSLSKRKTIIIIAHRLTTVQQCDTILMMENGQILAQGNYKTLLQHSDQFRRLAEA